MVGILYEGSSIIRSVLVLLRINLLSRNPVAIATMIPKKYNEKTISPLYCAKNTLTNRMYTGSLAEHEVNGMISVVSKRSSFLSSDLVAIIAGTLHPKPSTRGMNDLPCKPILCIKLSIMYAALAK